MAPVWNKSAMLTAYNKAKSAKVGETIVCPTCGKHFVKTSYQQAFCRMRGTNKETKKANLCKDQYWNFINPRGEKGVAVLLIRAKIENIAKYDEDDDFSYPYEDDCHPFSEDAVQGGF